MRPFGEARPSAETSVTPERLIPNDTDRWSLRNLIELCRDRLGPEDDITFEPDSPMANLHAMIKTRKIYAVEVPIHTEHRAGLSTAQTHHLQRMMVLHHKTVSSEEVGRSQQLTSFLETSCRDEYRQFDGFRPDLTDMPYEWTIALEDVQLLRLRQEGDPE